MARFAAAEPDLVEAIAEGIGALAAGEWAPLNRIGDIEGAKLENGVVRLPAGFAEAYAAYAEQGWNAISGPAEFGGQGLPLHAGDQCAGKPRHARTWLSHCCRC